MKKVDIVDTVRDGEREHHANDSKQTVLITFYFIAMVYINWIIVSVEFLCK